MSAERVSRPVAVFDTGVGGLTVAAAIHRRLPKENLLFLADRARVPYASLSISLIVRFATECFDFLLAHDPKAIVVACNTVSAVCLDEMIARAPIPVLGVIEPTARAAVEATATGRIGVLATKPTVRRRAYEKVFGRMRPSIEVVSNGAPLLVPLVEEGWTQGEIPARIVEHYLEPLRAAHVDTLVLGCTHYEYFRPLLRSLLGERVNLINTPEVTARELEQILGARNELIRDGRDGSVTVYSTDVSDALERIVGELFPEETYPNQVTIQSAQIPPRTAPYMPPDVRTC